MPPVLAKLAASAGTDPVREEVKRKREQIDEALGLTPEERERLRAVDEQLDAEFARMDAKLRLS